MSYSLSTGMMDLGENVGSSNITQGDIDTFFSRNPGYTRGQLDESQYQQFVSEQVQEGVDVRARPILASGAYLDS